MIKVLICDDDNAVTLRVKNLIKEIQINNKLELELDVRENGDFMLSNKTSYDIAIVDIEMNGINGLRLSELLKESNPDIQIIILTSFNQYLDDAMQVHVFRYLSKPIEKDRFVKNFTSAVKEYTKISKIVLIEEDNKTTKLKTKDILYIENLKYGSLIQTKDQSFKTNKKPKQWFEIIDQQNCFAYSHNSILVNLQNVIDFDKSTVTFRDNKGNIITTYMSQRKYTSFKKAFYNFAGGIK